MDIVNTQGDEAAGLRVNKLGSGRLDPCLNSEDLIGCAH